jgi:hypothetical protein
LNFPGDIFDVRNLERERHAMMRPHRIDRDGKLGFFPIDNRLFEQNSLSTTRRFHFTISPFGDEQICIDRDSDALQLACMIKGVEETAE